jgi:hypothetical protein
MHIAKDVRYPGVASGSHLQEARAFNLACFAPDVSTLTGSGVSGSAGVVEDDFPSMRAFAPYQGKYPVVLGSFAVFGTVKMELAGNEGDLGLAAA